MRKQTGAKVLAAQKEAAWHSHPGPTELQAQVARPPMRVLEEAPEAEGQRRGISAGVQRSCCLDQVTAALERTVPAQSP